MLIICLELRYQILVSRLKKLVAMQPLSPLFTEVIQTHTMSFIFNPCCALIKNANEKFFFSIRNIHLLFSI